MRSLLVWCVAGAAGDKIEVEVLRDGQVGHQQQQGPGLPADERAAAAAAHGVLADVCGGLLACLADGRVVQVLSLNYRLENPQVRWQRMREEVGYARRWWWRCSIQDPTMSEWLDVNLGACRPVCVSVWCVDVRQLILPPKPVQLSYFIVAG